LATRSKPYSGFRAARRGAGFQLDKVQRGLDPDDWKPMKTVGAGVNEIRVRDAAGAFRVIYVARLAAAIFVLHCFEKKSRRTPASAIGNLYGGTDEKAAI
jgi:phage-related protein